MAAKIIRKLNQHQTVLTKPEHYKLKEGSTVVDYISFRCVPWNVAYIYLFIY